MYGCAGGVEGLDGHSSLVTRPDTYPVSLRADVVRSGKIRFDFHSELADIEINYKCSSVPVEQ